MDSVENMENKEQLDRIERNILEVRLLVNRILKQNNELKAHNKELEKENKKLRKLY